MHLRNFRNYKESSFVFAPGVNLIVGENGEGKTNLLEALFLFVTGRSFKSAKLPDLMHFGSASFYLELRFIKDGVEQELKLYGDKEQKKIFHNATSLATISALFGILLGVLFSPTDIELIKGLPKWRRLFLDLHIAQSNATYLKHLSRYTRALKQRNALLKEKNTSSMDIWESEMALSASFIMQERQKALGELSSFAEPMHRELVKSKNTLKFKYDSSAASHDPAYLREEYEKHRPKELELGFTIFGPQKDDVTIFLESKSARVFASEGQARTIALILRLSEWERFRLLSESVPLLFFDDFKMGLDGTREKALLELIANKETQIFLTTPRLPQGAHFGAKSQPHVIPLSPL